MKRIVINGLAATAIAAVMPVAAGVAPAHAACYETAASFAVNGANSSTYNASTNCEGLTVMFMWNEGHKLLGQYYTGTWQDSSIGWKFVSLQTGNYTNVKIVGDTIDGRLLRGLAETRNQLAEVKY